MGKMVRVLIVDDSALMRQILTAVLSADSEIEVVGTAADPYEARAKIKQLLPDVVTLDIEMPKMDGLDFLEKIMTLRPMPVVMVSSLTQKGADATFRALELGAIDVVGKPTSDIERSLKGRSSELQSIVKCAATARVKPLDKHSRPSTEHVVKAPPRAYSSSEKIVAIGSSTGGVESVRQVVSELPSDGPAVLVTQHMPGGFTKSFADRLDRTTSLNVSEASEGQRVLRGHVYIAPGGKHLALARSGANFVCRLLDTDLVNGHKPSCDVLFDSVADVAGKDSIGVILTGMGRDGAAGLLRLREAGAFTIGQDEATSVVYGMPRVAYEIGAVIRQLPLARIAAEITNAVTAGPQKQQMRL